MPTTNQPIGQLPYFYDNQLRRILTQFMRIFTVFKYSTGLDASGNPQLVQIPVIYGEPDRQATQMLMGNSENVQYSVPRIAVSIINLKHAPDRRGFQGQTRDLQVQEREFDQNSGQYTPNIGNSYSVEQLRPNPLDIQFRVDVITSNTDQKFQIFEQIYLLFNPSLDFQTTSSPLDWTALNVVTLDDITWDFNGPDVGTDTTPDVLSLIFTANCWVNPPSRVTRQVLIHTIIERIGSELEDCDNTAVFGNNTSLFDIVTPDNATIILENGQITLLGPNFNSTDENNNTYSWPKLLDEYGGLNTGESKLTLRWVSDITDDSKDIIGLISLHPTLDNILLFNVINDTLPMPTQVSIDQIINPHSQFPGNGLPSAAEGQRYIISDSIGRPTTAWGNLNANANDIIQYTGGTWVVSLDVQNDTNLEFVLNSQTGNLLKLVSGQWIDAVNAKYAAGFWNLLL